MPIPTAAAQDDSASSRYQIILAYIYNFTQFTTWPSGAVGSDFSVCVVGDNPFGSSLTALRTRSVDGRKIVTRLYRHMVDGISACNVLFIAEAERGNEGDIMKAVKGTPVLTMSDMDGFVDGGGMVEFARNEQKVGIRIGLRGVQAAGLTISSKLLRIAETVN